VADEDTPADRFASFEMTLRKRLADHRHPRGVPSIGVGDSPAGDDR
jgi:hypothetical protein